jgi:putative transposase
MGSNRRLPHIYPQGRWLFLTWHLYGSLPQGKYPPSAHASAGRAFVWMDRYLDRAQSGPRFLQQESIARLVMDCLLRGSELGHYQLGAFSIMANHVHALVLPQIPPSLLLKSLKGYSAHEANRLLGRTGEPFWQRETYDHWVRDHAEWQRIAAYIENNPVKAGLVLRAEDYHWSSAHETWRAKLAPPNIEMAPLCVGKNADVARTSACSTSPADP